MRFGALYTGQFIRNNCTAAHCCNYPVMLNAECCKEDGIRKQEPTSASSRSAETTWKLRTQIHPDGLLVFLNCFGASASDSCPWLKKLVRIWHVVFTSLKMLLWLTPKGIWCSAAQPNIASSFVYLWSVVSFVVVLDTAAEVAVACVYNGNGLNTLKGFQCRKTEVSVVWFQASPEGGAEKANLHFFGSCSQIQKGWERLRTVSRNWKEILFGRSDWRHTRADAL